MANAQLIIPSDPSSEIYFDPRKLVVGFRARKGATKPASEAQRNVLRVVVQAFGRIVDDRFFPMGSDITAGPSKKAAFKIPTQDLPDEHTLIRYNGDGSITLMLNKHFSGVLQVGNKLELVSKATGTPSGPFKVIKLPRGSKGCLEHGTLLIYFEEIPDPEKVPPVAIFKLMSDPNFMKWLVVSIALHLMFLLMIKLLPDAPPEITLEQLSPKFQKIIIQPRDIQPYKPMSAISAQGLSRGAVGMEGEGAKAAGPEGRRGKGIPGRKMSSSQLSKQGVLAFFSKGSKGKFNDLIGGSAVPGSVDSAINRNARFGLPGERDIRTGKGLQGGGTGGGGLSTSIGQGLGTKGHGGGAKGAGLADFGTGKGDTTVSASIDEEEVFIVGTIPKEVIAKIINDHMGQIRYCYERQLRVQPEIRGKIMTNFVIGLTGAVTSARTKQSTMQSPPVEDCVLGVIRRMPFPKPGGGVVEVTYPFLFHVAGHAGG